MRNWGHLIWVRQQLLQEQRYPFLSVCTVFLFGLQRMFGCQCLGFLLCTQMLMQIRAVLPIPVTVLVCAVFLCGLQRMFVCPCLGFLMCVTLTDVDVYECTWGLYGKLTARRKKNFGFATLGTWTRISIAPSLLVWCLTNWADLSCPVSCSFGHAVSQCFAICSDGISEFAKHFDHPRRSPSSVYKYICEAKYLFVCFSLILFKFNSAPEFYVHLQLSSLALHTVQSTVIVLDHSHCNVLW